VIARPVMREIRLKVQRDSAPDLLTPFAGAAPIVTVPIDPALLAM